MLIPALKKIFKSEKEIIERDFRDDVEIDRELATKFAHRNRGSIRVSHGMLFTMEEYEKWREKVLASHLP